MRIIRGIYKARRFFPPKSFPSRPTTDYAKEGLFNVLEHKMSLFDLEILDLCSGTGNISLEFLSREAGVVTSVDKHPVCIRYMYELKKNLNIGDEWMIAKNDVLQFTSKTSAKYDLIFSDPPYDAKFHATVIENILEHNLLHPGGRIIIEHGKQTNLSHLPYFEDVRNFGNVYFSFFKLNAE